MNIREVYNSKSIAAVYENAGSNKIPYLGAGLFPAKKKAGLELKWIVGAKGLPVSLSPSAFDTVSTIRSREGAVDFQTEMAFFKESMLIKEQDEQDIMRVVDAADPFAQEVIERIFDDAETLVSGADVVPERMRMQLLSSGQNPSISIAANGATYAYNYDPDNTYRTANFKQLTGTSVWTDLDDSDPLKDIADAQDSVEGVTGVRPSILIVSRATMNLLKQNDKIKSAILAQNVTANVLITDNKVIELFKTELGVDIIVYTKQYKDESGSVKKFYPDGMATLIPNGPLGSTWYGMTPEERTLVQRPDADVRVVNTGVAVAVTISDDPVQTKTTVSEIVLPSFERMLETYQLQVAASVTY